MKKYISEIKSVPPRNSRHSSEGKVKPDIWCGRPRYGCNHCMTPSEMCEGKVSCNNRYSCVLRVDRIKRTCIYRPPPVCQSGKHPQHVKHQCRNKQVNRACGGSWATQNSWGLSWDATPESGITLSHKGMGPVKQTGNGMMWSGCGWGLWPWRGLWQRLSIC